MALMVLGRHGQVLTLIPSSKKLLTTPLKLAESMEMEPTDEEKGQLYLYMYRTCIATCM